MIPKISILILAATFLFSQPLEAAKKKSSKSKKTQTSAVQKKASSQKSKGPKTKKTAARKNTSAQPPANPSGPSSTSTSTPSPTPTLVTVTTLAGSGIAAASFAYPEGVAVDESGNIYVADTYNHRICKITPNGSVATLAGSENAVYGYHDRQGTEAKFWSPSGVAVDRSGNVYVGDADNHLIRKITPSGGVTTLAGSGSEGYGDGQGTGASFNYPSGVAVDGSGNVYVADWGNQRIRKITPSGGVTTLAGSGFTGSIDGQGTASTFFLPFGVAVDESGNVYVADWGNHRIRKITPSGGVTTLAGSGIQGYAGLGEFYLPKGVAVDGSGNVYVADTNNLRIRKITTSQ